MGARSLIPAPFTHVLVYQLTLPSYPESVTTLLLVRHGETDWNSDGRVQGHLDVPLNAAGRAQAARLADILASVPIDAIYTSDLSRASETASAIAARHGLAVHPDPGLRERLFGAWQGLSLDEVAVRFPEQYRLHREGAEFAPAGSEAFQQFQDRVCAAVERIADANEGRTVVITTH